MGYFSFCSNPDVPAKETYLSYKQRRDIEQCFDYLRNSVSATASYAHSDDYFRGRAFLNHISPLYYYGLLNALRETEPDERSSAQDVLKRTKNIYPVNTGSSAGNRVSAIQKKTMEVPEALKVTWI